MTDLAILAAANLKRWQAMKIKPEWASRVEAVAHRLAAARPRYEKVAASTGVPWDVIAVIHERESSQSWNASLAQGDPWNQVSVHVPKGRGPFASWEAAAIDALAVCPPYAARWKDWTPGGRLTLLEQYNGLGYARMGIPSPYIWSGTDQYAKGKYIADGLFDSEAVDKQIGCAALLAKLAGAPAQQAPHPAPSPTPQAPPKGLLQIILDFILSLLKGH